MLVVRASHSLSATQLTLEGQQRTHTLFQISETIPQNITLPPHSDIILTSTAAIPALRAAQPEATVHCVNATTANAAKKAGLTLGLVGNSDAAALAELICTSKTPPLLFHHLTTPTADTNWYATLTEQGHAIQRHTAYRTEYAKNLTPDAIAAIQQKAPILLFSAKSANHLLFLANRANISIEQCAAHVISPKVADVCRGHFKSITTAKNPTLTDVLNTL